jgi:sortase (surface protein transpeptidase)
MFNLSQAHAGQRITIRHTGKTYRFTVVDTATFDRDHRLPHRYFTTTGRHRLVLISCTHRVTRADGHFHYTRYQVVVAHVTKPIR